MKISEQLQLLNETLGPNCNWKSSCYQLQSSWVAVFFQLVQLDLRTLYIIATSELLYDTGHCMDSFCVVSTHAAYRILFISGASKPALNIYSAHKTDIIATSKSIYDTGHFMDFFCVISTHASYRKLSICGGSKPALKNYLVHTTYIKNA